MIPTGINLIKEARDFATEKHAGQKRKYSGDPYIVHPEAVAKQVHEWTGIERIIAVAWLHDVVEDCGITKEELDTKFGSWIAERVMELSDPKSSAPRKIRKAASRLRLRNANPDSQMIKAADILDNIDSIVENDPDFAKVYLMEKAALVLELKQVRVSILYMVQEKILKGLVKLQESK